MHLTSLLPPLLAVTLAPLQLGLINRTKARFAGRQGQDLLQPYHDLLKLLRKGAVYSRTTTWVFRATPVVGLASVLTASLLLPFGGVPAPLAFTGDLVLFAYLLGIVRVFTVLGALDTGSSFEAMGASREVQFSALAEPALLLGLLALARHTGQYSLSGFYSALQAEAWSSAGPMLGLLVAAFSVVYLTENSRIPVDDPNTHLELTMIHEVMILDTSGPDLAFVLSTAALKLWLLGSLVVGLVLPAHSGFILLDIPIALAGMGALAVLVGVVESVMARLRLLRVPQLLVGAGVLSSIALVLVLR